MKKKLFRFLNFVLIFITVIMFAGCAGFDPDDEEQSGVGSTGYDLEGVMVLRRPLSYDFDGNSFESDYYARFSEDILYNLFSIYGIVNYRMEEDVLSQNIFEMLLSENQDDEELKETLQDMSQAFETTPDEFVGFFDAIRYQISNVAVGTENTVVTANLNAGWKWTLPYNTSTYPAWLTTYETHSISGDTVTTDFENNSEDYIYSFKSFERYYTEDFKLLGYIFERTDYETAFVDILEDEGSADELSQTDYQLALEYAIYRWVLGIEPNNITRSFVDERPVLSVEGFTAQAGKSSVQLALEDAKEFFYEHGTFVGLTETNKNNIVKFILEEVIGEQATNTAFAQSTLKYEQIVEAVVGYAGTRTTIGQTKFPEAEEGEEGQTDDQPTHVGETFIASETVVFPSTSFFSSFTGDPFQFVAGPYEYQSFVLMPSVDNFEFSDLWLDFKYDANLDGDTFFTDETLDIKVSVRWHTVQTDADGNVISRQVRQVSKPITVKDGPANLGYEGTTLEFELFADSAFGENVKIGKFNVPDALKPDTSTDPQNRVVTITGTTDARKYYKVLESGSFGYGVLNEEKFNFSYCEIAFDVTKDIANPNKNYAFYCAISQLYQPSSHPNDPVWQ